MFHFMRTLAVGQLQSLGEHKKLVVVHPHFKQQHIIMGEFSDDAVIYVRFEGTQLSLTQLQDQFDTAIIAQQDTLVLENTVIILDECDRAETDALDQLLFSILTKATPNRVVILSREVPQCTLSNPTLQMQTAFIPNDRSIMLWDYSQPIDETALLEVRAFGEGQVLLNGRRVDNWDGVLPRALFFYLVDRGMVTRDDIFTTFWPEKSVPDATNVFHVTKRKINEVLGINLTVYWSGFYRISPEIRLSYDTVLFTQILQDSAVTSSGDAINLLTRASALYRGSFLSTLDMPWANKRRSELMEEYGEALTNLAKAKEEAKEKRAALGLYLQAAANVPHSEDLTRNIMRLYHEHDMPIDAIKVYDRYVRDLNNDLGLTPPPQLLEFANTIQKQINTDDN